MSEKELNSSLSTWIYNLGDLDLAIFANFTDFTNFTDFANLTNLANLVLDIFRDLVNLANLVLDIFANLANPLLSLVLKIPH